MLLTLSLAACGGSSQDSAAAQSVAISVVPTSATVTVSGTEVFQAMVQQAFSSGGHLASQRRGRR